MSNNIILAKKYSTYLNEVYAQSACSAALESDSTLVREGGSAREIVIPSMTMDGMADYSRRTGFIKGNVNLTWNTVTFDYERGRLFEVDAMDDAETQGIAFGRLAGEFMRTKAIPELDAYRFASLAGAGLTPAAPVQITDGEEAVAAIRAGVTAMDERAVPYESRLLFISNTVKGYIEDMDTTKSTAVMGRFEKVIEVPQNRFYTEIELNSGAGGSAGGYSPSEDAEEISFMIVHKPSVICFTKHAVTKVIPPEINPESDDWRYAYRCYGLCTVLPGKTGGVYTCAG